MDGYNGKRENGKKNNSICFQTSQVSWSEVSLLTDRNGDIFTYLAAEAMKASGISILEEKWKKRLGLNGEEKKNTLQENAGKEDLKAGDVLTGYDDLTETVKEAERKEAEKEAEKAAEKAAENENSDSGQDQETDSRNDAREEGIQEKADQSEVSEETEEKKKEGKKFFDLLEMIQNILNHGVLGIVVPEDHPISSGRISGSDLPSDMSSSMKARSVSTGDAVSGNQLLVQEYLMRNMDCFTSEGDKSVAYELEYLIAGKKTDEANLTAVVHRVIWIRMGMNLLYLGQSPEKRMEAKEAASLMVAWTGHLELIEPVTMLLLTVWALVESILDVRELMDGKKVSLMKTDVSWKTSLENLAETITSGKGSKNQTEHTEEKSEEGLSYEDYLRICLTMIGSETLSYRALDVIQWNMQRLDPDFLAENCMVAGICLVQAEICPAFSALYSRMGILSAVSIEKKGSFSYLTS